MMSTWFLAFALSVPLQTVERESFEVWLCPIHRDEQATGPETCPVCDREMVQRLLVPSYSCPMHQHIDTVRATTQAPVSVARSTMHDGFRSAA